MIPITPRVAPFPNERLISQVFGIHKDHSTSTDSSWWSILKIKNLGELCSEFQYWKQLRHKYGLWVKTHNFELKRISNSTKKTLVSWENPSLQNILGQVSHITHGAYDYPIFADQFITSTSQMVCSASFVEFYKVCETKLLILFLTSIRVFSISILQYYFGSR